MSPVKVVLVLVSLSLLAAGDRVLLSDVQTLTFRKGELTAHRRVDPVFQLACVSGPCESHMPESVRCVNKGAGYDLSDISWECSADMSPGQKIVGATVGCEGYEHSDDPYVLAGSCGVEFSIQAVNPPSPPPTPSTSDPTSDDFAIVALIVFGVFLFMYVLYCISYIVWRVYVDCCGGEQEPGDLPPPYFSDKDCEQEDPPANPGPSMGSAPRITNNYYSSRRSYSRSTSYTPTRRTSSSSTTFHARTRNR